MNGPAHYREAERLLRVGRPDEAQAHATLALAAATAHETAVGRELGRVELPLEADWREAIDDEDGGS